MSTEVILDEIEHISRATPESLDVLMAYADHEDAEVRFRATEALGDLHAGGTLSPRVLGLMQHHLQDPDWLVRFAALETLEDHPAQLPFEAVSACLADEDALVRGQAAITLAQTGDARAAERIAALEPKADAREKASLAFALHLLGEAGALERLIDLLKATSHHARSAAASLLPECVTDANEDNITGALRSALKAEQNDDVREAMEEALDVLAG